MSDHITIVGNIAGDPRHTQSASGVPITTFRVASSPRRFDRASEKWVDGETSWYSVSAFRALALNTAASLRHGERVIVSGRLSIREWTKGDRSGTTAQIDAESIGHDLLWGTTRFHRAGGREADSAAQAGGMADSTPAADDGSATNEAGWYAPGTTGAASDTATPGEGAAQELSHATREREEEPVPF